MCMGKIRTMEERIVFKTLPAQGQAEAIRFDDKTYCPVWQQSLGHDFRQGKKVKEHTEKNDALDCGDKTMHTCL